VLSLPALDISVPMGEIYAKIEFPPVEDIPKGSTIGGPVK